MDRRYELETLRRSLAMLSPEMMALSREEAVRLVEELQQVWEQVDRLRDGLRKLLDDSGPST